MQTKRRKPPHYKGGTKIRPYHLAQKEWVAEVAVESTEEIPAGMRKQLIAMEDLIGASKRKALKEKLDV